jgi:divalent metal cation (Fe/Co/Zn/Cd) transporter
MEETEDTVRQKRLLTIALALAVVTVFYNLAEGLVSVFFGVSDESLSLFGFGLDSFVEVMSGIGIWHMVLRMKRAGNAERDGFEKRALRVTAVSFFILAAGLVATVAYNLITRQKPESTLWGILVSCVSLATMVVLMSAKLAVGKRLDSEAIIADAHCTRTCIYLSLILLASSLLYMIFKIELIDAIGGLGIALLSFLEGRESWEKAKGKDCGCH